jgi:hypothetical protein
MRKILFAVIALMCGWALVYGYLNVLYSFEQPDLGLLGSVLVYGALIDELLKFGLSYSLYRLSLLPRVAIFVGLGYGLGERSLYWISSGTLITLDYMTAGMHTVAGLSSAYFLNKYQITSRRRDLVRALIAPIVVHGTYNALLWIWYQCVLVGM